MLKIKRKNQEQITALANALSSIQIIQKITKFLSKKRQNYFYNSLKYENLKVGTTIYQYGKYFLAK